MVDFLAYLFTKVFKEGSYISKLNFHKKVETMKALVKCLARYKLAYRRRSQ
jgi:hypothetical protein